MAQNQTEDMRCDCEVIHEEAVALVRGQMPDEDRLFDLADFYKVLADSTRIRIVQALVFHELCVCDISALLNMSQSAISHQLRLLKQSRLVKSRKAGKIVYYSIDDEHVSAILALGLTHIAEL